MLFSLFFISFLSALVAAGVTCFASILLGHPILLIGEFAFLGMAWVMGQGMESEV